MSLNEGVHDKGALKFVFLAGGPGSGKNYVANQLFGFDKGVSFGSSGMKLVSFDAIFEKLLEKEGIDTDLSQISDEDYDAIMDEYNPKSLYSKARKVMKKQLSNYVKQGLGIVFDGTGRTVGSYLNKKDIAEYMGYDTHLIYVDVPLDTALDRNAKRARKLPEDVVAKIYRDVKRNRAEYERVFGDNMMVIDNHDGAQIPKEIKKKVEAIMGEPVKNKYGQHYMANNGQLPAREKPTSMAPPLPKPQTWHPDGEGGHSVYTSDKKIDGQHVLSLYPHEIDALKKKKDEDKPKWQDKNLSWWERFKLKQQEKGGKSAPTPVDPDKHKGTGMKPMELEKKKDTPLVPSQDRIHNPETGNDILVTTALGYPPGHPMRHAAEKFLKQKK